MRRLLLLAVLVPTCSWLLWASCQSDDYRDTLPLRGFDAAPQEGGPPSSPPDLSVVADLAKSDQGQPDLPRSDGGAVDGGGSDAGGSDGGTGSDAGGSDGGRTDGGVSDGGLSG